MPKKKVTVQKYNCPNCIMQLPMRELYDHVKLVHGEQAFQQWRLSIIRDRRANFENEIFITTVTGRMGSGKSLFVTSQVLDGLASNRFDLVISNMFYKTELLNNPAEWKRLAEEFVVTHFPPKWPRKQLDKDGWEEEVTIKRSQVITQNNRIIDWICQNVKPEQFVHIETETTSSAQLKKIIEDKAREMGLVDTDGTLLIRVLIVWDEAFSVLESRRSGTSTVIDLSEFALQSRHYGCKIWIVSPLFPAIDVRYRTLCQEAIIMTRIGNAVWQAEKSKMIRENKVGVPIYTKLRASSVAPVFFFYNTWERPIVTLTELEREAQQEQQVIDASEKVEFTCPKCHKTVLGQTNFKAHLNSHTGETLPSQRQLETARLEEQVRLILKIKPDATLTEIATTLNRPLTTIHDVLARLHRISKENDNKNMTSELRSQSEEGGEKG